ncbi:MAG: hypothetical protein K2N35_10130 [Muribaculaceae bacterium]|nr:hypothetical protein [Muribaculaceae bacterium]
MKNLLKIPILFTVVAVSACRSHKKVEVSDHYATDSCKVQTDLTVHSITNIEKNEYIDSLLAQDQLEFKDGAGEIRIHSNGEVSIKGLKSAHLMRQNTHKHSATTVTLNDSVAAKSQIKSTKTTTKATKANTVIPVASSIWLKVLSFIIIPILVLLTIRYIKSSWLNSKN